MRRLLFASYGVLATLVGMAAGHLVAALLNPAASPVLAVGSTVIDLTPTPVKEFAVAQFGTADKPILIGSVLLGTLVLAGIAGVLAQRSFVLGAALLLALVGLAGAAALARPTASVVDAAPAIAAAAVGLGALALLTGGVQTGSRLSSTSGEPGGRAASEASDQSRPRRRSVLLLGAGAVAMGAAGQWIGRVRSRITAVDLPAATDTAGPFPKGLESRYDGISPLRTPTSDFYRVDTRLVVPTVGVDDWTLTIDGDVEKELTFTFDELSAMPLIERDITLNCVSNSVGGPYISSARWLGVRLTDLLEMAGVGGGPGSRRADQILSTDVDGFTISTPLEVATDGRDAMVVLGMNGGPLPRERGFPCRLLTPGLYGYVGATKWLTKLTLTTYEEQTAYWTERDWAIDAPVKIASRVDTPKALASLDAGKVVIGGVAWAQRRGIAKVEVSIDDGDWQVAELGPKVTVDYWRQWYLEWDATSGRHDIAVRATTEDGEVQTEDRADPFPDGASGWQSIAVIVA
ncbi:molybdopterin-dependent oxidoreductase [Nocardioides bigeumensis]